ncbi:PilZ domain-containing protein [Altericroceibacterium xinjiangense]|uniref:PilZ domain-containing protein n=1 Tax=Altericroceibacterium xinjiangense TaxID=762261 RepID=UPI000F7E09AD|nr:PilZ domain-containing protein [Altericroceibacterium xinjiangense]
MSILSSRAQKRYAVRTVVRVRPDQGTPIEGLMIELSSEAARISNLGQTRFSAGQLVAVELGTGEKLPGSIRWANGGIAGIKFDRPLHIPHLNGMIGALRGDTQGVLQFGT